MNPLFEAAKQYLVAGFHPIPVDPARPGDVKSGKRPLVDWKRYQTEAPTVADLERWWGETPNANIALPMGRGRFVLDVDGDEGFDALREAGVEIPRDWPCVATGKGAHYYFVGEVPDRIGVLPKVDVRSIGGYVVAPPSMHYSGRQYTWTNGDTTLLRPPQALLELMARPQKPTLAAGGPDWVSTALAGVGEGQRSAMCTRLAGYFIGLNIPPDIVQSILFGFADNCTPPYEYGEVAKIVANIDRRHVPDVPEPSDEEVVAEEDQNVGGSVIIEFIERLIAPATPKRVVSSGLPDLDKALNGGFYPGQVTLFAGIGGIGKSITAQMLAIKNALDERLTLYATLEMPPSDVLARLVSYFTYLDSRDIVAILHGQRKALPLEIDRLRGVIPAVKHLPLLIRQQSVQTTAALDRTLTKRPDIQLLVVDQLQHLQHPDGQSGMYGLEANSRALVALAGRHDIPIVALSQVNRPEGRERYNPDWRPSRYSLRGSEQLYHDAAVVVLFHRTVPDALEIQVNKSRMGGATEQWLKFSYSPRVCRVG